mmetsp:Transcript_22639/g.49515  ORF Transcript_22639/g.49515 Transcript_22639/m.49515 type:complete len:206 (-) Transcript_22639:367-984(-)
MFWALLQEVACGSTGAAGAQPTVEDLDLGACWNIDAWVLRFDVCVIPSLHLATEDLGQQTGIQLQAPSNLTIRNGVEHTNGSQGQGNVHHRFKGSLRSHGLEMGAGHGNVTSAEVAVALVPAVAVTNELLLASATANSTVSEEQRDTSSFLHQLHGLCKPILGVGGATAMQGDNAISIQMSLHGVQALLHRVDRTLKVTQFPQGV